MDFRYGHDFSGEEPLSCLSAAVVAIITTTQKFSCAAGTLNLTDSGGVVYCEWLFLL